MIGLLPITTELRVWIILNYADPKMAKAICEWYKPEELLPYEKAVLPRESGTRSDASSIFFLCLRERYVGRTYLHHICCSAVDWQRQLVESYWEELKKYREIKFCQVTFYLFVLMTTFAGRLCDRR
jgi:hypothetical protein